MNTVCLWTKNFIALLISNALLFAGFHILLPTLPLYAAANGANAAGAEGQNASDAGTANNDGNVYDADYKVEDNGDNK